MAQFVFKLEVVLRHRRTVEREKLRELSIAQLQLRSREDQLKDLQKTMEQANDDLRRNRLIGSLDVSFLAAHRRFLLGMQRRGMELVNAIAQAHRDVETARAKLIEAAKQVKVLEKLREKQQQRWQEEQSRRELLLLDEIGTQIGSQRMREAG